MWMTQERSALMKEEFYVFAAKPPEGNKKKTFKNTQKNPLVLRVRPTKIFRFGGFFFFFFENLVKSAVF